MQPDTQILRNIAVSETGDLITADARKPAPEFRDFIRALATPAPYGCIADHNARRRIDIASTMCGKAIDYSAPHWVGFDGDLSLAPVTRISAHRVAA